MITKKIVVRTGKMIIRPLTDNPAMRLLCVLGKHSRSRRHVYRDKMMTYSECRWCSTRMAKSDDGTWNIVPPAKPVTIIEDERKK